MRQVDHLDVGRQHARQMQLLDEVDRALEHRAHRRGVRARRGQPEHRILPGVLAADLRDRELNSLRTRRTIERTTPRFALSDWDAVDVQLDDARADDHSSVAGFSSSSYVSIDVADLHVVVALDADAALEAESAPRARRP